MSYHPDMYSYEEFEVPKSPPSDTVVKTPITKGSVTELEINGKKFELVNPEYIRGLQSTISTLTTGLQRAERTINTLNSMVRKLGQEVKDVSVRLDRKIDRI